jgi:ABC-type multidrug transport system fused ATPase/permease subunit
MSFGQVVKRFFEPFGFNKVLTIKALFPAVANWLIRSAMLVVIKNITNIISGNIDWNINFYTILFVVLSVIYLLIIYFCRNWTSSVIWTFWRQCFYEKYMKQYLEFDNNESEKIWIWRLITIIDKWFHTHIAQIMEMIHWVIPNIIQIIVSVVFIFFLSSLYWSIVVFLFVLLWFLIYRQQNKADKIRKLRNELNIWIMRNFVKILMSKFEVLSSNKWTYEIWKLTKSLEKNRETNIKQEAITIWIDLGARLLIDWISFIMIVLFWFWFLNQSINVWEFASLIWIVYFLDKAISQIQSYYVNFLKNYVEIEKLRETFDSIKKMPDVNKWLVFTYKSWNIQIKDIWFSYDKSSVFQNFNLEIKGWTKTAFVGESWGGKTTLMKLLAWYIRPDSGDIEIDGQKLYTNPSPALPLSGKGKIFSSPDKGRSGGVYNTISLQSYYKHIGYLTQDPSVFDGTIYENLVYALDTEPIKEDIEAVIKLAKCEFIREFKKWLKTEIGERWIRLSGGQKQRLAIAKIMLKNPNIILLDEPTSALDSFNEELINIALHNLFKGKTVIVVAHRLQTVKQADRICYIEQWKIVEEGTHHELVKLNGKYKKMLDLQSGF